MLPFDAVMAIIMYEQTLSVRLGHSILGAEKVITTDGYLLGDDVWVTVFNHR